MPDAASLIDEAEFVVLDVETTGLEPDWGHRVCEVGLVVWRGGTEIDRLWSLANPGRAVDPTATLINNLTDDMLRDEPPIDNILPVLHEKLSDRVLVAYNASFDVGFLRAEFRHAGLELPSFDVVDVMTLARRLLPDLKRFPLAHVAEALGIPVRGAHRAMADVEATSGVFFQLLERLAGQGVRTLGALNEITRATSPAAEALRRDKVDLICEAIRSSKRVHLIYRARDAELTERDVSPVDVSTWAGRTQLVGYCHMRDAERTFNVDAIQDVRIID